MRKFNFLLLATISFGLNFQCTSDKSKWQSLLNGKDLSGWDTYNGPAFDSSGNRIEGSHTGLNNDPLKVFSVVQEDGAEALRISGERFGGISTQKEFENYHFRTEFKWGKQKWPPRKNQKRDSGILYHAVGPHGADYGFWMRSQEFQVQEGDCGDYWGVAGGVFDIPAIKIDSANYRYDPAASPLTFSEKSQQGRRCIKNPDVEKPSGEWNVLEVYCSGDTSVHVVNGVVNMILYRSRQSDNGTEKPLTKGKIQIQSEGAEVYYRRLEIRAIESIPVGVLKSAD